MKFKKTICAVLSTALTVSCFAGCKKEQADNAEEKVKLKWVMLGPGKQSDADVVWDEFNKRLGEYVPNTEVEFEIIEGSAFSEKWQLMSAASEQIDLAWSGYAIPSFLDEVDKGAYRPLTDLIDKVAPSIREELPEWVLDLATINGEIYCIPNYQVMSTSPSGLHIRKEHEQYIDIEKVQNAYMAYTKDESKGEAFYATLAEYLENMKQVGKIGNGVGMGSFVGGNPHPDWDATTVPNFSIDTKNMQVRYNGLTDHHKLFCKTMADWYKKGYIRSDILSENMDGTDEAEKGYILWQHGYYNNTSEKTESMQKGFDTRVFPLGDTYYIKNAIPQTMTTIARTSVNPERAMKVLELMHTKKGKDIYNLLSFGIEGEHYEKISENRIKPFDYTSQGDSNSKYGLFKWAVGNTLNAYELPADEEGMAEYVASLDENATILPAVGFKPDTSDLSVELAQLNSVEQEYKSRKYGAHQDWEGVYNEYVAKLKTAGVEKVTAELQKQLDAWVEANKK